MSQHSTQSHLAPLIEQLVACIRTDIDAQRSTLETLEAQRAAIQNERLDGIEDATAAMVEQMRGMQDRDRNRQRLVEAFAKELGQPIEQLTISMVAQLAGIQADELMDLRQQLRNLSARVIRENRKLSALVGMRRRIVTDVIDSLLQSDEADGDRRPGGVLINAEA